MAKGQKWNPTSLFDPFVIASAKMLLIFCYQTIMCPQCVKFQKKESFFEFSRQKWTNLKMHDS